MVAHTPGPYTIHHSHLCTPTVGGGCWVVADVDGRSGNEGRANLALFATAPDLLEAAQKALNWLDRTARAYVWNGTLTYEQFIDGMPNNYNRDVLRTAIAKATGSTQP